MMDAPVSTPGNPLGAKGCQFAELIARAAPKQNSRIATILMITMVVFASALSLTPRTRIQVTPSVISRAGTLNHPAGPPGAGNGGKAHCGGKWKPKRFSNKSWRYAEN